jgi:Cft2 family RNA processing exonuclease
VEWRQWTLPGSQVNANSETLIREALFGAFGTHPVEAAQRETALDTIVEEVAKDSGYTLFIAGQSGQTLDTNVYTALASKHSKPAWRVGLPGGELGCGAW